MTEPNLLRGPQEGVGGFLINDSDDDYDSTGSDMMSPAPRSGSSGSAASFMSPAPRSGSSGSAASFMSPAPSFMSPAPSNSKYKKCTHLEGSSAYTCKKCWDEYNFERRERGLPNAEYRGRCKHGVNYSTTGACCQRTPRPYAKREAAQQSPLPPVVTSAASAGLNPNPRLSFSEFQSVDPKQNLINYDFGNPSPLAPILPGETFEGLLHHPAEDHDDEKDDMYGGSKSYRKSARKLIKKAKRSSRKAKRSSRKAKRSSRKAKRSSRKAKRS
jgi:hypothetical protein